MTYFPEKVLEHIFGFLNSHKDMNSVSLVCKSWFRVEGWSRQRVFLGNCYAIRPERMIRRFPRVKALTLKGRPHFADFNLIPHDWGGFVQPWIEAMVKSYPGLEELRLKRMVVSDDSLELISHSFRNLKSLVLVTCDGFSTDGLAAIAANCKVLRELDLQENEIEDDKGNWLSCFPETCTSLVSLNSACLKGDVNLGALERLVARNPNLRSLKLNRAVPLDTLQKILVRAPQLVDLGIGSYMAEPPCESYRRFIDAAMKCRSVRSLSGFWEVAPRCLKAVYSMCLNLTSLNLSYAPGIPGKDLIKLMPTKPDPVTTMPLDEGFRAIVQSCKGLKQLSLSGLLTDQVFLYIGMYAEQLEMLSVAFAGDSDKGMLYVLNGCKNLRKLEIRDSPFGDGALLADVGKYETMRSLWMSSCDVTLGACKTLAKKMHRLNVEIINEKEHMEENFDDTEKVEKMYVYRTLYGPRRDAPDFVWSL